MDNSRISRAVQFIPQALRSELREATTKKELSVSNEDLAKEASLKLSTGHLLVVWDVVANKLSGTQYMDELSEEERRAIWALQDLCERGLVENGLSARPEAEWNELVRTATEHVKSIPVEFLD